MSGARTPNLCDAINATVDSRIHAMHTALPGRIEKYDRAKHRASVKPLIRKRFSDGTTQSLPVIVNVPVVWPRTSDFEMSAPLKRGDGVLLIFAERSIDAWLSRGEETTPQDTRKYDISDAIAIPGLFSFKQGAPDGDSSDLVVRYKESSIRIKASGDIEIGADGDTLKTLMTSAMIGVYNEHTHGAPGGTTAVPNQLLSEVLHATGTTKAA